MLSRRSHGISIGLNVNPDKACNFDCIYCQVDRTTESAVKKFDLAIAEEELREMLEMVRSGEFAQHPPFNSVPRDLLRLNDIALSGDAEPTTLPNFSETIQMIARVKPPEAKIMLITDAGGLDRTDVKRGLEIMDANNGEVWAKLDAGTEDYFELINRTKIPFARILKNISESRQSSPDCDPEPVPEDSWRRPNRCRDDRLLPASSRNRQYQARPGLHRRPQSNDDGRWRSCLAVRHRTVECRSGCDYRACAQGVGREGGEFLRTVGKGTKHLKRKPPAKRQRKAAIGFSADRPIVSSKNDLLGRKGFAESLAKHIERWGGHDSLVIALCGEWGCGKTSIKNMVLEHLRRQRKTKLSLVEFNPWESSGRGSLTTVFFHELATVVGESVPNKQAADKRVAKLRAYAKLASLGGTVLKLVGGALHASGEASGAFVASGGLALKQTGDVFEKAADADKAKDNAQELSLAALKRSLAKEMATLEQPILIVIDDLDRLTSDEIREVFQLVKANANFPNLIYLLMFDRGIVSGALDAISGGRGQEFLDKIVQVLFHVPQPSLKDVHRVLFEGLDVYLKDAGMGERWNQQRWNRMWLDGLANYFTNLRNVYRFLGSFGFHISQMRTGSVFELNLLDLMALESLRLFEPALYEAIPSNRTLLLGERLSRLLSRREETQQLRISNLDRLLAHVTEDCRAGARCILEHLFPRAFGVEFPDDDSLARDLRVGSASVFDRYFTLTLSSDDISEADLSALRNGIKDITQFTGICVGLSQNGKLENAFKRLDAYRDLLPTTVFPEAITSLANVADAFANEERFAFADLGFDTLTYAWRLVYFGLKRVDDKGRRFELLQQGITGSECVRLAVKIVSSQERIGDRQEHDFLISREHCEELKSTALERLRTASKDGRLRSMPGLVVLLWRWHDWGGSEEVRDWIAAHVKNAADALWILRTFLQIVRQEAATVTFFRYLNLKNFEMFVDVGIIEKLTCSLALEELVKDDQRALRAFRQALIWRAEGKPPDYFGDHQPGENPLAESS